MKESIEKKSDKSPKRTAKILAETALMAGILAIPSKSAEMQQAGHKSDSSAKKKIENTRTATDTSNTIVSHDTLRKEILATYKDTTSKTTDTAIHVSPSMSESAHTDTLAQPAAEKTPSEPAKTEPKKTEIAKTERVLETPDIFGQEFKNMIAESMKEKKENANLKEMKVFKEDNHLGFHAVLHSQGFIITITGKIVQKGETLSIDSPQVKTVTSLGKFDAGALINNQAKGKILPRLEEVFIKRVERTLKEKGKEIKSTKITPEGVVTEYKI